MLKYYKIKLYNFINIFNNIIIFYFNMFIKYKNFYLINYIISIIIIHIVILKIFFR